MPTDTPHEPVHTLTVPARPAALAALNVTTLATAAVVAAGPLGIAAAAVVPVAAAGLVVGRRARRHRKYRRPGMSRNWAGTGRGWSGSGWRLPSLGRATAPKRTASPGGRHGTPPTPGTTKAGTARTPVTRAPGTKPSPRPRPGANTHQPTRTPASRATATHRPHTGQPRRRPSMLTGLANTSRAIRAGLAANTPRRAAAAARRAATNHRARKRGAGLGAAALAAGTIAARNSHRKLRRWVRRHILGHNQPTSAAQQARNTAGHVRQPCHQTVDNTPTTTPAANRRTQPVSSQNQQQDGGRSVFFQSARRLHAAAAAWRPRGMIEVRAESYELPHSLAEIAAALRARAQACTTQPLDPQIAQLYMQISACVDTAAQAATRLGPAFDALHHTEVQRILRPRPDEGLWDTVNNRA